MSLYTPEQIELLYQSEMPEVLVMLVTFSSDSLPDPLRISTDNAVVLDEDYQGLGPRYGTISRGLEFTFFPLKISLPTVSGEESPHATLEISNVSRELIPIVRAIPPGEIISVKIELVTASAPDVVMVFFDNFEWVNISLDAPSLKGELVFDAQTNEPFPGKNYNVAEWPAIFGAL